MLWDFFYFPVSVLFLICFLGAMVAGRTWRYDKTGENLELEQVRLLGLFEFSNGGVLFGFRMRSKTLCSSF